MLVIGIVWLFVKMLHFLIQYVTSNKTSVTWQNIYINKTSYFCGIITQTNYLFLTHKIL